MIVVHHLNNSRSQRILWLLEELGLQYRIERYQRDAETSLAPPELLAVHPLGKSPVVTDEQTTLAESGAIIEYLVDRYDDGALAPERGSDARHRYTYWLHYAEGSLMPPLLMKLVFHRIQTAPMPFFVRPVAKGIARKTLTSWIEPQIRRHFDYIENELAVTGWFAGEHFSAADIQMSFALEAGTARAGLDAGHPNIKAFLERIHTRESYTTALDKGGPYELLS